MGKNYAVKSVIKRSEMTKTSNMSNKKIDRLIYDNAINKNTI